MEGERFGRWVYRGRREWVLVVTVLVWNFRSVHPGSPQLRRARSIHLRGSHRPRGPKIRREGGVVYELGQRLQAKRPGVVPMGGRGSDPANIVLLRDERVRLEPRARRRQLRGCELGDKTGIHVRINERERSKTRQHRAVGHLLQVQ